MVVVNVIWVGLRTQRNWGGEDALVYRSTILTDPTQGDEERGTGDGPEDQT